MKKMKTLDYSKKILVYQNNINGNKVTGTAALALQHYNAHMYVVNSISGYAYSICTHIDHLQTVELRVLKMNVDRLINHAKDNPQNQYLVTKFKGFNVEDVGPMFAQAPTNMKLPYKYRPYMMKPENYEYWFG